MAKSRNQMFVDLTSHLTEKSIYKVPSQRGLRDLFHIFGVIILKRVLEEHFPKRKNEN